MLCHSVPWPAGHQPGHAAGARFAPAGALDIRLYRVRRSGKAAAAQNQQQHGNVVPQHGQQDSSPTRSRPAAVSGESRRRRRGPRQATDGERGSHGHQPQQQPRQQQPQQQAQQQPLVSSNTKQLRQQSRRPPSSSGGSSSSSGSRPPRLSQSTAVRGVPFHVPGAPRFTSPGAAQLCQRLCACTSYQAVQQVLTAALEPGEQQQQQPLTAVATDAGAETASADTAASSAAAAATTSSSSGGGGGGGSSSSSLVGPAVVPLDAATTAVLLPHLAHLGTAAHPSFLEDAALQALLPLVYDCARAHLPSLSGPAAQGALLALAQLKYVDGPSLASLLEEARPGLGEWRLPGAAALLVALARGGLRPSNAWLAAVMQEAQQQLPSASLHTLSSLLWGLVQLGVRPAPTWMRGYTAAAAEAASAAAGAAEGLGSSTSASTRGPSSRRSTSASSRSRGQEGARSRAAPQQQQQQGSTCVVSDVARLLSALAEARLAAAPALSSALLAAAGARLAAATSTAAVELLAAAGSLQLVPGDAWLAGYCRATLPAVPRYTTWQLATSVLALGQLQEAMDAAGAGAQGQSSSSTGGIIGPAKAVSSGGGASLTFAVVFQQQLRQQQEAAAAAAPAGAGQAHSSEAPLPPAPTHLRREELCQQPVVEQWLEALLAAAQKQLHMLAARELADLLRGLALLQRTPGQPLMAALMAEVVNKLPRFTAAGLASVIDSSVALQQLIAAPVSSGQEQQAPLAQPQPQQVELLHQEWWAACLDAVLIKLPVLNIQEVRQVLVAVAAAAAATSEMPHTQVGDAANSQQQQQLQQQQQQQQQQHNEWRAVLQRPSDRWVAAVAGHAQGKLTLLPAEGLLQVQAALGALGYTLDPAWTGAWLAAAQRQLEAATPQQLLQVLRAAAQQQAVALSGAWLSAAADAVGNQQLQASWEQQLQGPGAGSGLETPSELQECGQLLQAMRANIAQQPPPAVAATTRV